MVKHYRENDKTAFAYQDLAYFADVDFGDYEDEAGEREENMHDVVAPRVKKGAVTDALGHEPGEREEDDGDYTTSTSTFAVDTAQRELVRTRGDGFTVFRDARLMKKRGEAWSEFRARIGPGGKDVAAVGQDRKRHRAFVTFIDILVEHLTHTTVDVDVITAGNGRSQERWAAYRKYRRARSMFRLYMLLGFGSSGVATFVNMGHYLEVDFSATTPSGNARFQFHTGQGTPTPNTAVRQFIVDLREKVLQPAMSSASHALDRHKRQQLKLAAEVVVPQGVDLSEKIDSAYDRVRGYLSSLGREQVSEQGLSEEFISRQGFARVQQHYARKLAEQGANSTERFQQGMLRAQQHFSKKLFEQGENNSVRIAALTRDHSTQLGSAGSILLKVMSGAVMLWAARPDRRVAAACALLTFSAADTTVGTVTGLVSWFGMDDAEYHVEAQSIEKVADFLEKVGNKVQPTVILKTLLGLAACLAMNDKEGRMTNGALLNILRGFSIPVVSTVGGAVTEFTKILPLLWKNVVIALRTRSALGLFADASDDLVDSYNKCLAHNGDDLSGTYPNPVFTRSEDYSEFVRMAASDHLRAARMPGSTPQLKARSAQLDALAREVVCRNQTPHKRAPFAFLLAGPSSCAKSYQLQLMDRVAVEAMGGVYDPVLSINYNQSSKYFDAATNGVQVVHLDDAAQGKACSGYESLNNHLNIIINMVNNINTSATMAAVELKGRIFPKPLVFSVTTNVKKLNSHMLSNYPIAAMRRFNLILDVVPLHVDAVTGLHDAVNMKRVLELGDVAPNLWEYKIQVAVSTMQPGQFSFATAPIAQQLYPGLERFTLKQTLHVVQAAAIAHKEGQDAFMNNVAAAGVKGMRLNIIAGRYEEVPAAAAQALPPWRDVLRVPANVASNMIASRVVVDTIEWFSGLQLRALNSVMSAEVRSVACSAGGLTVMRFLARGELPRLLTLVLCCKALALGCGSLLMYGIVHGNANVWLVLSTLLLTGYAYGLHACLAPSRTFLKAKDVAFISAMSAAGALMATGVAMIAYRSMTSSDPVVAHPAKESTVQDQSERTATAEHTEQHLRKTVRFDFEGGTFFLAMPVMSLDNVNYYAANAHIIDPLVRTGKTFFSVSGHSFRLQSSDVHRPAKERDVVVFRLRGLSPVKDLRPKLASTRDHQNDHGLVVYYPRQGSGFRAFSVAMPSRANLLMNDERFDFILAKLSVKTQLGDCGSMVGFSGNGQTGILGIHSGATGNAAVFSQVYREDFDFVSTVSAEGSIAPFYGPLHLEDELGRVPRMLQDEVHGLQNARFAGVLVDNDGVNPCARSVAQTRLQESVFNADSGISALLGESEYGIPYRLGCHSHMGRFIRGIDNAPVILDESAADAACADLASLSARICGADPAPRLSIYDGMNGVAELGIKAMKLNTAGGVGLPGKKSKYVERVCTERDCDCPLYHDPRGGLYPNSKVCELVNESLAALDAGQSISAVFRAALKDESRPITSKKVRVFLVGQMHVVLLTRMLITPIFSRMMANRGAGYEAAIGIDSMNADWHDMVEQARNFAQHDEWYAGDYVGYDNTISLAVLERVVDAFIGGIEHVTTKGERKAIRALLISLSHPKYVVQGIVLDVDGTMASGLAITSWWNSFINSWLMRYFYYRWSAAHAPRIGAFSSNVFTRNFGDDAFLRTSDAMHACPVRFNNFEISKRAAEVGMIFGPTEKGGELVESYTEGTTSFLKRTFEFSTLLNRHVGRYELGVVRKCLTFQKIKGYDCNVSCSTASSALHIYFSINCLDDGSKAHQDLLREHLIRCLAARYGGGDFSLLPTYEQLLAHYLAGNKMLRAEELAELEIEIDSQEVVVAQSLLSSFDHDNTAQHPERDINAGREESRVPTCATPIPKNMATTTASDNSIQGSPETAMIDGFLEEGTATMSVLSGRSERVGDVRATELGASFERKVLIHSREWEVGTFVDDWFNPWKLLLDDPVLAARVLYSWRMNCGICLQMDINGSPMHYGLLRLVYRPHPGLRGDEDVVFNLASSAALTNGAAAQRNVFSQLPGFSLDVSSESGGCMEFPFIGGTGGFNPHSSAEVGSIGTVHLTSFTQLYHANAGSSSVTVNIYANFTNVSLDVSSVFAQGFTLEEAKGSVVKGFRAAMNVYAATHEIAGSFDTAMSLLGMSRPVGPAEIMNVRNIPANMANCNAPESNFRLAVYDNSSMTVDGRELGTTGLDELQINGLCARESVLDLRSWATTDPTGTFLGGYFLTPTAAVDCALTQTLVPRDAVSHTPMSMVASAFDYWTGDVVFTVSVIASASHKGRMIIKYEPSHGYSLGQNAPVNVATCHVLDLAEARSIEVRVPWSQHLDALSVLLPETHTHATTEATFSNIAADMPPGFTNGYITLYVQNSLVAMSDAALVRVMVSVKGERMAFYSPRDLTGHTDETATTVYPQGFDISGGECVESVRMLMKRPVLVRAEISQASAGFGLLSKWFPSFPPRRGFASYSYEQSSDASAVGEYNLFAWSHASYFAQMFALWRGSMRFKVVARRGATTVLGNPLVLTETTTAQAEYGFDWKVVDRNIPTPSGVLAQNVLLLSTARGQQLVLPDGKNNFGDVEVPQRSAYRAYSARAPSGSRMLGGVLPYDADRNGLLIGVEDSGSQLLDIYSSVGEDFSLFCFLHAPVIVYAGEPTTFGPSVP